MEMAIDAPSMTMSTSRDPEKPNSGAASHTTSSSSFTTITTTTTASEGRHRIRLRLVQSSTVLSALLQLLRGDTAAAPPPVLAFAAAGPCAVSVGLGSGSRRCSVSSNGRLAGVALLSPWDVAGGEAASRRARRRARCLMAAAGGGEKEEEKRELAAEVVGAVTKATVGFAVDRAAATVSEERGLERQGGDASGWRRQPVASRQRQKGQGQGQGQGQQRQDRRQELQLSVPAGAKRRALVGLLGNLWAFLRADGPITLPPPPQPPIGAPPGGRQARHLGGDNAASDPHHGEMEADAGGAVGGGGVIINGYWFPSLAAAAEAPAAEGFDFAAAAAAEAAAAAALAREERQLLKEARRRAKVAALPKGADFTCGAVLLSCPIPHIKPGDTGAPGEGVAGGGAAAAAEAEWIPPARLPLWRRLTVAVMERTGLMARAQQAIRDSVPRMPRQALMMVAGVAGAELAKREIAAQVEALEEPVREPAWALLNETYRNVETLGMELMESGWDVPAIVTKQLADWKRRGVGNSYQEALLKEFIQLQTRALLRSVTLPPEEGSLIVQLNATYRSFEESIGRLLPQQTKEQLSLLEGVLRKLEDKGIGELSFDEVYRALLLGAVPPTLVTDAVRLLAAGRPGEGGGAAFLSGEAPQAYDGRGGGDVTLAALAARLNDTLAVSRAMTYTAVAAETETIDNLREALDILKSNIRKSLVDMETELMETELRQPPPSVLQGAASYVNKAARSAVTVAIDGFNNASKIFDASFEALAEPSRRTLLRSSELLPWYSWYQARINATDGGEGEDEVTPVAAKEQNLLISSASVDGFGRVRLDRVHGKGDDGGDTSSGAALHHRDFSGNSASGSGNGGGGDTSSASVRDSDAGGGAAHSGGAATGARPAGAPTSWLGRRRGFKRWRPEEASTEPPRHRGEDKEVAHDRRDKKTARR